MNRDKTIIIENLSKTFSSGKKAVDRVNIKLEHGEIFGFLGPNGAGKTTTVKLLNGMLEPSEGTCWVHGVDPAQNPEGVHAISGVVTEHAQMYDNLTGLDNLIFFGSVFGVDSETATARALVLLDRLDLSDAKDQKLAQYSTGMRQRLSLARALIHKPRVLFLDEPTSGLDPESAQSVNNLIRSLALEEGATVFLCTHQLRYAQEICTSYGLISEGSLLANGTLSQLRSKIRSRINVRINATGLPADISFNKKQGDTFEIAVDSEDEVPKIVKRVVEGGGEIYQVVSERPTLEEIYFTLIEKQKDEKI